MPLSKQAPTLNTISVGFVNRTMVKQEALLFSRNDEEIQEEEKEGEVQDERVEYSEKQA